MPPVEFEINAKRSASLSSDVATKPATTSLCPPKYFVAECKTISIPKSNGFC